MICVKSQTKEKWVNEGWHQPIALEERHVTASGAPGGCGPHGERHAPPPSHGYFQEQRLRWAIVPSHRRSLPVIKTQMWVVLPRFTVIAANFACLWMRSPVSQRCEQRTHTVCLPDARPPVCTPSRKVTPGTHTSRACLLAWKALGRLQTMILHGVPQPRQRGSVTALLMSSVGLADDCCCCRSLTRPQTAHVPT